MYDPSRRPIPPDLAEKVDDAMHQIVADAHNAWSAAHKVARASAEQEVAAVMGLEVEDARALLRPSVSAGPGASVLFVLPVSSNSAYGDGSFLTLTYHDWQPHLSCITLVTTRGEVVEDSLGVVWDLWRGGDLLSAEADRGRAQGAQGLEDLLDAQPGSRLRLAGYGQGGEDDGQVGLD